MFDRFTENARRTMVEARQASLRLRHDYIGTEHILLGFLTIPDCAGARILGDLGIDLAEAARATEASAGAVRPAVTTMGQLPFTPGAKHVLEHSLEEAQRLEHNYIRTEHLLLGLIREGSGIAAQVLLGLGVTIGRARAQVKIHHKAHPSGKPAAARTAATSPSTPRATQGDAMPPLLRAARDAAADLGHRAIGTEHLLLAIAASGGAAGDVLRAAGATSEALRKVVSTLRRRGSSPVTTTGFAFTPYAVAALEDTEAQAAARSAAAPGPEHLLLAVLAVRDGLALSALAGVGVDPDTLRETMTRRLGGT